MHAHNTMFFFITKLYFQTNTSSGRLYQRAIITPVQMLSLIYNIKLQCVLSFMFGYLLNGQAYFGGSECTECNMHKSYVKLSSLVTTKLIKPVTYPL